MRWLPWSAASPSSPAEIRWDPAAHRLDPAALAGADAVINLSGAGIGDRPWTRPGSTSCSRSRLGATRHPDRGHGQARRPARGLSSASPASGYYGDSGSAQLRETASPGSGILAPICVEWEAAAHRGAGRRPRGDHPYGGCPQPLRRRVGPAVAAASARAWAVRWAMAGSTGPGSPCRTSPRHLCFLLDSGHPRPGQRVRPREADVNTLIGGAGLGAPPAGILPGAGTGTAPGHGQAGRRTPAAQPADGTGSAGGSRLPVAAPLPCPGRRLGGRPH